ncbi:hydantoinase B/oxoprolinase family protein [Sphingomonas oryzagri]|uniref:Hydantoinase B/oxoprolinase family protein n=1 Tax=Sphingomonas oryzagri TaxID=3042314 RepID=A0ABT6N3Z2_9SPHN|nr:hydantoinase B/oxoprolinase family protein [Sphingomonas oryzagri]MDH7640015.1 hydantoinase B/oxoprolinase family protein [Sphingomonas oryzagri]
MSINPDPITSEVVRNAYNAIADDMSAMIARSAYSPILYEAHDYGIALFDRQARLLGQYAGLPLFTGGLDAGLRATIERYGLDGMRPGDVFTVNDSYITGGHLNDVDTIGVIADEEEVLGFIAVRAHWADIGTAEPGFPVNSRNIFQEGVRWGPTRIMEGGEWVRDVIDLLCLNSRVPKTLMGDLKAQIAAIRLGAERMKWLKGRFGQDMLEACATQIFSATEAKFRGFIRSIPDGIYTAEGTSDNDGVTDEPVVSKVTVTIAGDHMTVDTHGSAAQRPGNLNTGYANTVSAVRLALALLMPEREPDINDGSFRAMDVIAESGSIYAAEAPAPCMRPHPVMLLIDLIIKALSDVLPEHVAAGLPGDSWNIFLIGKDPKTGQGFTSGEALDGGWGASARGDGPSAIIHSAAGDFRNMPVETLEYRTPVIIRRLELGKDSGGDGEYRGGQNVVKEYEALADMGVTLHFDRSTTPEWGLFGGQDGAAPKVTVYNADKPEGFVINKVEQLQLRPGDRFVAETGGGGGYGDPAKRTAEARAADIADGISSVAA